MRRWLPRLVAAAGLALLVTGAVLFATGGPAESGEVLHTGSYEPLTDAVRATYLHTGQQVTGAVCGAAGGVLLAAVGGWAVGRGAAGRARRRS